MPRAGRVFEEGRIYHVFNRVAGGAAVFSDDALAVRFVELLREAVRRDDLTVLGWSLLGNHYHLILRQGPVVLSRSMKTLQQGAARARNIRDRLYGPLWQGRFKAKDVTDERYLKQLVAYVHLNPVKAGLAETVDEYCWSGHKEIIDRKADPIVSVDDVLLMYGESRRAALRSYRASISAVDRADWGSYSPGELPWWRIGRPTEEDLLKRRLSAHVDEQGRSTGRWRPKYGAEEWLKLVCAYLDIDQELIEGRGRGPEIVEIRELIGLVGIERFGVKAVDLARALGKSPDGVSKWMRRGVIRRETDQDFAEAAKDLELVASEEP